MNLPIYLDHNATTPCDPRVLEDMLPWFGEKFGNASSSQHPYGWLAEDAVEQAREQVAALINAKPKEIIFTSGATEAVNLGLKGLVEANRDKGNHLITVSTEHAAVLDTCRILQERGTEVTYLPVNNLGLLDLHDLENAIQPGTLMIIVMLANNETGVIQHVKEISAPAKGHGLPMFSDAVQAVGKIPVDVNHLGIDMMPISAHKMYGPKGVGALYIRKANPNIKLSSQITGGGQEFGIRSGTLNVPGIVGFGRAAEIAQQQMDFDLHRLKRLRDVLEHGILEMEGTWCNQHPELRLPHVSHISFEGVEGKELLIAINKKLAVSSGSACSSVTSRPSHVLKAMGLRDKLAKSSLRFGLGRTTTDKQVELAIHYVRETVMGLRKLSEKRI